MRFKESELINRAAETLRKGTNLDIKISQTHSRSQKQKDGIARIMKDGFEKEYLIVCKRHISKEMVFSILLQARYEFNKPRIFITEYLNDHAADHLRADGIPFFDAAGNAFINERWIYVDIRGKKPERKVLPDVPRGIAYQPSGLKVLFALLYDVNLVQKPLREIADKAGVANGTVGWTLKDLKTLRFLINLDSKKRRIIDREKLMKEWIMYYPITLRPKLIIGKYRTLSPEHWWEKNKQKNLDTYWGGEVAAAAYTNYLKPASFTLYTRQNPGRLIAEYNLKEDEKGNIEILKAFWGKKLLKEELGLVPPLLVYADLLAQGDPRNIETAKMIYDKGLLGPIR